MSVLSNETEVSPGVPLFVTSSPGGGTTVASNLSITPFPGLTQSAVSSSLPFGGGAVVYYKGSATGNAGVGVSDSSISIGTNPGSGGGTTFSGNWNIPLTNPPTFNAGTGSSALIPAVPVTQTGEAPGTITNNNGATLPTPAVAGLYLYMLSCPSANSGTNIASCLSQLSAIVFFNGNTFNTGGAFFSSNGNVVGGPNYVSISPSAPNKTSLVLNNQSGNNLTNMSCYVIPLMGNIQLA